MPLVVDLRAEPDDVRGLGGRVGAEVIECVHPR